MLWPLIRDARPVTHQYVHECCLTIPVCVCLGENDPYYIDTISMPALLGLYQGAKPQIYHDTRDNQKPRVHDYDKTDHNCIISYLDDIYHIGLNLEAPSGHLPKIPFHHELPPRPPSPALTDELESEKK